MSKRIPFRIKNLNHGFSEATGLLHLEEEKLVLEFETKDSVVGIVKSGLREVSIPFSEIEEIRYTSGFFSGKIELTGKSMKAMEDVPGAQHGIAVLHVRRRDRKKAGQVLSKARLELSEFRLKELED